MFKMKLLVSSFIIIVATISYSTCFKTLLCTNRYSLISNKSFNNEQSNHGSNMVMKSNTNQWSPSMMTHSPDNKSFDAKAVISYILATFLQWNLIRFVLSLIEEKGFLFLAQLNLSYLNSWQRNLSLPKFDIFPKLSDVNSIIVICLMFFLSLRSRIFSPLDNSRPKASSKDPVFRDRKRPSWQPPAIAFPIIWTTISILRTASAYLIYKATGSLVSPPLLAFFAHLSIGDTWNTINNVENRLGTAALGVLFVLGSVFYTTYQYYQTYPLAGYILAPSCLWLSIATVLIFTIWRINYESAGKPSFWPSKEEGPRCKWKIPLLPIK